MTEVIARTKKSLFWLYLAAGILMLAPLGLAIWLVVRFPKAGLSGWLVLLLALFMLGFCLWLCIRIWRAPENVIVREGDNLILPDGICPLRELQNVICRRVNNARGWSARWGTIILQTTHGEKKYEYVADVEAVHNRLIELMMQTKEN